MSRRIAAQGFHGRIALRAALTLAAVFAVCLTLCPQASGAAVFESDRIMIDCTHAGQGFVTVRCSPADSALKLCIAKGGDALYYDLEANGETTAFPLTLGDGQYTLEVYQQISGEQYILVDGYTIRAVIEDETLPFLYPNQYVWYTAESKAAEEASRLCKGLGTDLDKLNAVRAYVTGHIAYDYTLAQIVESGYLPSVDDVLAKGTGICFDYAALTACMLRSQGIPAQLVIGYADQLYHAWNNVFVDGQWHRIDTTAEANDMHITRYTEERVY